MRERIGVLGVPYLAAACIRHSNDCCGPAPVCDNLKAGSASWRNQLQPTFQVTDVVIHKEQ